MLGRRVDNEPWLRGTDYTRPNRAKSKAKRAHGEGKGEGEGGGDDPNERREKVEKKGRVERKRARTLPPRLRRFRSIR